MEYYQLNKKEVLKELSSSEDGLTSLEAKTRLKKYGFNEIKEEKKITPLKIFLLQFKSFIVYILIAAFIISLLVQEFIDATFIFVIIILNAILGFIQEYKAEKSIEALKKLTAQTSLVLRNNQEQKIPSKELVSGDIILIEEGTRIPADCYLLESVELKIDESTLTGESTPVNKNITVLNKKTPINSQENMLFSSTLTVSGHGKAIITSTGMKTEIGKIATIIQEAGEKLTPLQIRLKQLGISLGIISIILTIIVFVAGLTKGIALFEMSLIAISLAVAAIPEGLPAVVTICLALGVQRMIKRHVLIRKLASVETLGSTTVICSDKTGTLTHNQMTVKKIYANDKIIDVTGQGYGLKGDFFYENKKYDVKNIKLLLETCILCNNAKISSDKLFGDPTEIALLVAAKKANISSDYKRISEIPFSSEKKYMATVNLISNKKLMFFKGATEVILNRCKYIEIDNKILSLTKEYKEKILTVNDNLATNALRILAFAYGSSDKLIFLGLIGMIDPPRKEVKNSIELCEKAGIKVVMITGDHKLTAQAIAREISLGNKTLTGDELDKLNDKELKKLVKNIDIYARVSPEHKVRILEALQKNNNIVAMSGDGVNDAPALKKADIGVAVGSSTDVAREASDMILTDDNFTSIVNAVEEGRSIYSNIKKFVMYLLSSNLGELLTVFSAIMIGLKLPLIAIQILWMNLVTDGLPALALSVDKPEPHIMNKPPRNPKEHIINKISVFNMLLVAIIMAIGTLLLFNYYIKIDLRYAQTVAFTTLIMFQMFNVLNFRSDHSIFKTSLLENKKLIYAILGSIALQFLIIYTPISSIFKVTQLTLFDWFLIILVSCSVLVIFEIKKIFFKQNVVS